VSQRDIIIVGAGLGGLALARGLVTDGHRVRILERSPALRGGGAAVTIFNNGNAALAGLGIPALQHGGQIERMDFRDDRDRRLTSVDLTVLTERTGFGIRTIPRDRLLAHLAEGLSPDIFVFDTAAASVESNPGRATVVDTRGGRHTAEIVIGADGSGSSVRASTRPAEGEAVRVGWCSWQGLSTALPDIARGTTGRYFLGTAGLCGLMPAGDGLTQWWFDEREAGDHPTASTVIGHLKENFASYPEPVGTLLSSLREDEVGYFPHLLHRIPNQWRTGSTTLLGDAAHVFPPSQAQGANQALEDAWMLRQVLRSDGEAEAQLRRYERERVPRVRRVSRMAASEITNKAPNVAMRVGARMLGARLAGRGYLALIRTFSTVLSAPGSRQVP
jgi:FAD-dependent urate hydroxylase